MPTALKRLFSLLWPLGLGIILGLIIVMIYSSSSQVAQQYFISPLGSQSASSSVHQKHTAPLNGFLPYWNLSKADIPFEQLDTLTYFAVELNPDGSIKTRMDDHLESGWYKLNSLEVTKLFTKARQQGVQIALSVTAFHNDTIDTIIGSPTVSQQAINSIIDLVEDFDLDEVNLDFEYNLSYAYNQRSPELYPNFVKKLKTQLHSDRPQVKISVDLFANAFIRERPYDVMALAEHADNLILMGYDFHMRSSAKAGSVAPLKSQQGPSIIAALESALEKGVEPHQIILAMPLYGYQWRTTSNEFSSSTYPGSGALASYMRTKSLIDKKNLTVNWDHIAMTPWLSFEEAGTIQQIYFENDESLALKLQLINQAHLGGGAFWALGYEGRNASIWDVVEQWQN